MQKFVKSVEKFLADIEAGKKNLIKKGCDSLRELALWLESLDAPPTVAKGSKAAKPPVATVATVPESDLEDLYERLEVARVGAAAPEGQMPAVGAAVPAKSGVGVVVVIELLKVALQAWLSRKKKGANG